MLPFFLKAVVNSSGLASKVKASLWFYLLVSFRPAIPRSFRIHVDNRNLVAGSRPTLLIQTLNRKLFELLLVSLQTPKVLELRVMLARDTQSPDSAKDRSRYGNKETKMQADKQYGSQHEDKCARASNLH